MSKRWLKQQVKSIAAGGSANRPYLFTDRWNDLSEAFACSDKG